MNQSAFTAALLLLGVVLSGCPVYDAHDSGCFSDLDCAGDYVCDDRSGACVAPSSFHRNACQGPRDCGANETCSHSGTCQVGDCHFESIGCVTGYTCGIEDGRWQCLAGEPSAGGASSEGPTNSGGAGDGGAPESSGGAAAGASG
jgi:hypothetical protein